MSTETNYNVKLEQIHSIFGGIFREYLKLVDRAMDCPCWSIEEALDGYAQANVCARDGVVIIENSYDHDLCGPRERLLSAAALLVAAVHRLDKSEAEKSCQGTVLF